MFADDTADVVNGFTGSSRFFATQKAFVTLERTRKLAASLIVDRY